MNRKIKTSFTVPQKLSYDLRSNLVSHGYGLREKSRWICEALEDFISLNDYFPFIAISDEMGNLNCSETVILTKDLNDKLEEAIIETRKQNPLMEGVRSKIVRAAIIQRIIRSGL